jgi:hypothetical protein
MSTDLPVSLFEKQVSCMKQERGEDKPAILTGITRSTPFIFYLLSKNNVFVVKCIIQQKIKISTPWFNYKKITGGGNNYDTVSYIHKKQKSFTVFEQFLMPGSASVSLAPQDAATPLPIPPPSGGRTGGGPEQFHPWGEDRWGA